MGRETIGTDAESVRHTMRRIRARLQNALAALPDVPETRAERRLIHRAIDSVRFETFIQPGATAAAAVAELADEFVRALPRYQREEWST